MVGSGPVPDAMARLEQSKNAALARLTDAKAYAASMVAEVLEAFAFAPEFEVEAEAIVVPVTSAPAIPYTGEDDPAPEPGADGGEPATHEQPQPERHDEGSETLQRPFVERAAIAQHVRDGETDETIARWLPGVPMELIQAVRAEVNAEAAEAAPWNQAAPEPQDIGDKMLASVNLARCPKCKVEVSVTDGRIDRHKAKRGNRDCKGSGTEVNL